MNGESQQGGWLLVGVALAGLCVAGCGSDTAPEKPTGTAGDSSQAGVAGGEAAGGQSAGQTSSGGQSAHGSGTSGGSTTPEQPHRHAIPEVNLTDAVRQTCLVQVGQSFPLVASDLAQLPDIHGAAAAPPGVSFGQKLSVVCFWQLGATDRDRLTALDLLEFLDKDIARPFADQGLSVVCVHVGDSPALGQLDPAGEIHVPCLVDAQGGLFGRVATNTEYMPRIYLLDGRGGVLWFDVEYSSATRRYLREAIEAALSPDE